MVDMAAKKKAREERIKAKQEMISAQQGEAEAANQVAPATSADAVEPEVKEKK